MATRTITLTGRPPVEIEEQHWEVIASADASEHDGQVRCQANRESRWSINVRQHDDGRAIVYAKYVYNSNFLSERDFVHRRGVLLPSPSNADICDAIQEVCDDMASCEHAGDDAQRWTELAAECIADMPAEQLG